MRASGSTSPVRHVNETGASDDDTEQQLREEIRQIPLLVPWTGFVAHDASLSDDLNEELRLRVQDVVFCELETIYRRLTRQQAQSDAVGLMPQRATRTLLESRLVVEAKRKIDVHRIATNVKMAMQTAAATLTAPTMRTRRESPLHSPTHRHAAAAGRGYKTSVITQMFLDKRAQEAAERLEAAAEHAAVQQAQDEYARRAAAAASTRERGSDDDGDTDDTITANMAGAANNNSSSSLHARQHTPPLLSVQFPPREQTLTQAVAHADVLLAAADASASSEHVTHFRNRPVVQSAVADAGRPALRREPARDRVRYITSTRLGALPPTKRILDEYPIPKEIVEALERHRHYHVDESSLLTSFDAVRTGEWECYVRRAVPVERKPVSFVLASLQVAPARPVAPPSDIFHQHVLESASNDDVMLTDVQQLFDHTHESYREFRATLHRHLALPYLVDLSFRTSLNSTNYFVGNNDNNVVSSEPSVHIPEQLRRYTAATGGSGGSGISSSSNMVTKWRFAKSGVNRIAHRRGAIALHVKTEASTKLQRTELLHALCAFTPHEIQLMELWYTHEPDAGEHGADPVAMAPALSARFDAVWHGLEMPVHERLDLAVKYSSMDHSSRLADAVVLWETAAAHIREREELIDIIRSVLAVVPLKKNAAALAEENAMLQDLATCTANVKEILLLTYLEVGDFVTLGGNFYLARMEHETTELRRIILDSIEHMRRRSHIDEHITDTAATTANSNSPSASANSSSNATQQQHK